MIKKKVSEQFAISQALTFLTKFSDLDLHSDSRPTGGGVFRKVLLFRTTDPSQLSLTFRQPKDSHSKITKYSPETKLGTEVQ